MKNLFLLFLSIPILAHSQHHNVLISNRNNPNETSIAISPKDPSRMIAGSNIANIYRSADGGLSWEEQKQTSPFGVGGDPVVLIDSAGSQYHFHLSRMPEGEGNYIDRIVCQRSDNNGLTFNDGTFIGLNGGKAQDKPWAAYDEKQHILHLTWTQFDEYGSENPKDSSIIRYSRSLDSGENWSEPIRISFYAGDAKDGDGTVEGAVPAVGPNGEVYVSWAGPRGIVFNQSEDGGITWLEREITVAEMPGGWNFSIPGIYRSNGFPVTTCDLSNGPHRGRIYINWTDQRNGPDDTDVWLIYSDDKGKTWTEPKRVNNDPPGRHQFFTWMDVDPHTGFLWFVFHDRRHHTSDSTDVYLAWSGDGGDSFSNMMVSESSFLPDKNVFFGDYNNIEAVNHIVRPIWTRLDSLQLSVWTAIVNPWEISDYYNLTVRNENFVLKDYPKYPAMGHAISFELFGTREVNIRTLNIAGTEITNIMDGRIMEEGEHQIHLALDDVPPVEGIFYLEFCAGEECIQRQVIVLNVPPEE